jgi:hypothetical protein
MNGTAELPPTAQQQQQQRLRPSPSTLTTLPQVLSALSSLESEEAELSTSLSTLLSDQEPIHNALTRLQSLLPSIDGLYTEASALSRKVSVTARTAERVGGRVRTLDEEMRRVREASDRVQQVMELKVRRFSQPASIFPAKHVLIRFSHVLVIIVLSSVVNRRARLGIGNTTLFTGHGPPRGRDQRSFCRDRRRKSNFFWFIPPLPFLNLSLLALTFPDDSLLRKVRCLPRRHCRMRGCISFRFSRVSSPRRPRLGTRWPRRGFSSSSR